MCISSHRTSQILDVIARCGKCVGALGLVGGQVMDIQSEGNKDVTIETLHVPDTTFITTFFFSHSFAQKTRLALCLVCEMT